MHRFIFSVSLWVVALVGSTAAVAQPAIKVGILTELSGTFGPPGAGVRDGFLLYLKKSGGKFNGQVIETIVEDTGGDPSTAIAKVKKLVESDKVNVLLGPISSATGAAIKSYVSSQKIPTFMPATVDEIADGKYIFRTTFPANGDAFLQGYLAGKAGFKKAVAVAPNYSAGQSQIEYMEKGFNAAGGVVVLKLLPRIGTPDYGPIIGQFPSDADVGLIFIPGSDAVRFIKQLADYGRKFPLYGASSTVDDSLLPAQGKAAVGFVGGSPYYSTIESAENREFIKDWQGTFQGKPAWYSAGGYAAAMVLDDALRRVKGNIADTEAFVKAIKETSIVTPSGSLRFDKNNNAVQPRYIMQIREVGGVVQPVVIGTIPEFRPEPVAPSLPANLVLPNR